MAWCPEAATLGREVVVPPVAAWEERGPHRDGRDWSNAKAMCTRPKIPASPFADSAGVECRWK